MGTYSTINHAIWTDDAFLALSLEARLLFVYSWTHSPWASITGIDYATEEQLFSALGLNSVWDEDMRYVEDALAELGSKPLVRYDWDTGLLWAVNRLKYVCPSKAKMTDAVERALNTHLRKLPEDAEIVVDYKQKYRSLLRA